MKLTLVTIYYRGTYHTFFVHVQMSEGRARLTHVQYDHLLRMAGVSPTETVGHG